MPYATGWGSWALPMTPSDGLPNPMTELNLWRKNLSAADPNMTAEERAHLIRLLRDSQKEYLSQSGRKASPRPR